MSSENQLETSADRAERAAGGQAKLARILGLSQSTVNSWFRRRSELPAQHVLTVEKATGVSRHELRPDLYPLEDTPQPAQQSAAQPPASAPSPGSSLESAGGSSSGSPETNAASGSDPGDPLQGMAA